MNQPHPELPEKPTLADFQAYVKTITTLRGFDHETLPEVFQLFLEECGELAKAARKAHGIKTDPNSKSYDVAEEAADVFIYLATLCNYLGVDLEQAFRHKEEKNKLRTWSKLS